MGHELKVEIDTSKGAVFTNFEVIKGNVVLTTTKAVTLSFIQVKIEGIATTQLTIDENMQINTNNNRIKVINDRHTLLYDTLIVFPPENVRKVSLSKQYTLTAGTYSYPFEFRIPLDSNCASNTLNGGKAPGGSLVEYNGNLQSIGINMNGLNSQALTAAAKRQYQAALKPEDYNKHQTQRRESLSRQNYHIALHLPPSFMEHDGQVQYFIKATCKRPALLKASLRSISPFEFRPMDIDENNQPLVLSSRKEMFYRKRVSFQRIPDAVLPNKQLPDPPKKSFFLTVFGESRSKNASKAEPQNLFVSFEARFGYPACMEPGKPPSFKLFLVSDSIAQYLGKGGESNGLGLLYLQSLKVNLHAYTAVSAVNVGSIHEGQQTRVFELCSNAYPSLRFDLAESLPIKSTSLSTHDPIAPQTYELEIPKRYYENCQLPPNLPPTFAVCNIRRKYSLSVIAGITTEPMDAKSDKKKICYVDILCSNVNVLTGISAVARITNSSIAPVLLTPGPYPGPNQDSGVPSYEHTSTASEEVDLPTYNDAVASSSRAPPQSIPEKGRR